MRRVPLDSEVKQVGSTVLFQGKKIGLRSVDFALPDGRTFKREIVTHPPVVVIVPVTTDGKVLLIHQYRVAIDQSLYELPAGVVEGDESLIDAAQRELREETGFRAGSLRLLFSGYPTPGFSNELMHIFVATDLIHDPLTPDPDEVITPVSFSFFDVLQGIRTGLICDLKTVAGVLYAHTNEGLFTT